jgi:hypothetical protein
MENNPYQTPESDLARESDFRRSIWWKIYFFLITIALAFGFLSLFAGPEAEAAEFILMPFWLIATAGLFGFVFLKAIYKPKFWFIFFVVYVAVSIIYYLITKIDLRMGMSEMEFYISTAISWLMSLPGFYALYSYGSPKNPAWSIA